MSRMRVAGIGLLVLLVCMLASCGTSGSNGGNNPLASLDMSPCQQAAPSTSSSVPASSHVFLVVEENTSYSDVIGSSSMPYLNSLAGSNGVATQYFADTHPSIGNYFMLTTGHTITNDDAFSGTVGDDNLVRHLLANGKTWKSYAESLPSAGYAGPDVFPYLKHHNPFAYFSDVVQGSQVNNLVPFSQFGTDLANGQLPNFSFIAPNAQNDAHDCPAGASSCSTAQKLAAADAWLQSNIGPLIASASFQQDGLLLIVFDESDTLDLQHGGGHVAFVMVGPKVKKGHQSSVCSQHENALRTMGQALGLSSFPGNASSVPDFSEFF
jgi:hypothetical protein